MRTYTALWVVALLAICGSAIAQTAPSTQPVSANELEKVVVTSDLDEARDQIAPALGAVTYTQGPSEIDTTPGGDNASFQQILLRAPGVVEDSFGQQHVRGEHANLTYRVNGVILPEGLNGFGQELDTRLIDSVTLIDGSLPAQFGFRTAGIVDVTTKSGESLDHNELSIYGGSYDTAQPSIELGGTVGKLDYFITSSYKHDELGIENPTGQSHAIHDETDQERAFGYFSYPIDDSSRLSLLTNASIADFQIPDAPGATATNVLAGAGPENSSQVDENQDEQQYYTVVSYQKSSNQLSMQGSVFSRYGQIHFDPDPVGDLIFQGVAGEVVNNFLTNGVQFDASYIINDQHTLRGGFIGDYTAESLDTNTLVFSTAPTLATTPEFIGDNSGNEATTVGVYVQDEWRVTRALTVNYGLRYDRFKANFDDEDQVSPRVNFVYKIDEATTGHAGYSRYFVPPPLQFVPQDSVDKFANTTNAPGTVADDAPKVERSNYYDVGMSRQVSKTWQINADGFYKQSRNLVDEGQFGQAIIESPFNYATGYVYGAELSSTYTYQGLSVFGNFGWVETRARDINSQQFEIDPAELAYIRSHFIRLDHEGNYTASGGVSYAISKDDLAYVDALYGSGLRAGFANDKKLQQYAPVSLGYEHTFHPGPTDKNLIKFRFDVVNVLDEVYELRDGSGIGVGAPQFGERRGFFAGVAYDF